MVKILTGTHGTIVIGGDNLFDLIRDAGLIIDHGGDDTFKISGPTDVARFKVLNGGRGNDTVNYAFYQSRIQANLMTGIVHFLDDDPSQTQTVVDIEKYSWG